MHMNEPVKVSGHSQPDEDCLFCPGTETETYRTYPGKANNSTILALVMEDPDKLTEKQKGVRPRDGKAGRQPRPDSRPKPSPIHISPQHGDYSCEAHHLISGKQAMRGEPLERWIDKSKGVIEKDTGYSINNTENGLWLPSIPVRYKRGGIGPLWSLLPDDDTRYAIALEPMRAGKGQFHQGHHDIDDPDDPVGDYHENYKRIVRRLLQGLNDQTEADAARCYLCQDKRPYPPPYKLNAQLDAISARVQAHLLRPAGAWRYFISDWALRYHYENCTCKGAHGVP